MNMMVRCFMSHLLNKIAAKKNRLMMLQFGTITGVFYKSSTLASEKTYD